MRPERKRRGSALILAILVVLVLTVVGVGVAYFTQVEDQSSGNVRLAKAAFYGGETGLRAGERILNSAVASSIAASSILNYTGSTPPVSLPGGGSAVPLALSGTEYQKVIIKGSGSYTGRADVAAYSLFIRNNLEDPGGPTTDTDNLVNLISVGFSVTENASGGVDQVLLTKILEEQINLSLSATEAGAQKGANTGGTGAGAKGSSSVVGP